MCAPNSCLDVKGGSTASGANIQIYQSNGTKGQQFQIKWESGDYYTITAVVSGKRLDVAGARTSSGTNVQQCNANTNAAQRWKIEDLNNGYFRIVSKLNNDLCLDVNREGSANGTNVQIWKRNSKSSQQWKLTLVGDKTYSVTLNDGSTCQQITVTNGKTYGSLPTPTKSGYTFNGWYTSASGGTKVTSSTTVNLSSNQTLYAHWTFNGAVITEGVYTLTPKCATGSRLDINGGKSDNGANAQIYHAISTSKAQQFKITPAGDGYYTITCQASGKVLDVAGGKTASGTNVQQYTSNGTDAQKWAFEDAGGGYYRIIPKLNTNLCLDVANMKTADYTNVQVCNRNGYDAQKWKLTKVEETKASCTTHTKGTFLFYEAQHPHYNYYTCSVCGKTFTDGSTAKSTQCETCYPKTTTATATTGHWGDWSSWSETPVTASSTRQVETRQVEVTPARTEYRYGRYIDPPTKTDCWCPTYLNSLSYTTGKATLDYSSWSTTRYSEGKADWTCGPCRGSHSHVDHYSSDGRAWWNEYILPGNARYYWEETRTVAATYKTQYHYRDWIAN